MKYKVNNNQFLKTWNIDIPSSSWSYNSTNSDYESTITVSGIVEDQSILSIDLTPSQLNTAVASSFYLITYGETKAGQIVFHANLQPTLDMTVIIRAIMSYLPDGYSNDAIPVGTIMTYGGGTPPSGWLLCDGSAVSRTTYDFLFGVIGTAYGTGDGSTTFNLPNFSGRVPVGVSGEYALASSGGESSHTLTVAEIPSHSHMQYVGANTGTWGVRKDYVADASCAAYQQGLTSAVGGGSSHNNMQPYLVVNYIIKATTSFSVVSGFNNSYATAEQGYKADLLSQDYTSSSINTGRKWIDGRDIYQKVATFAMTSTTVRNTFDTDIRSSNIIMAYVANAFYIGNTASAPMPFPFNMFTTNDQNRTYTVGMQLMWSSTYVQVVVDQQRDLTGFTLYVVIEYTKKDGV